MFALLLRVPNLMTIPRLTDEYLEVGWAVSMVQQNVLPLTSVDAYDGPLFPYTLAFLFRTIGFNLYLPRVFMLFVGALTIVATFFLAKELARGDWRGGLLAALLLSANAHHILYNSHVAWSNDTTPLFTTLALLAYLRATRASQPRWLLAAGVLYGLALQTHPSVLALAPPLALDFLIEGRTRSWLKTWVPYTAVTLALVVYSPVLYYNLTSGGGSFQRVAQRVMAFETHPTLSSTRDHLVPLITVPPRVSFGTFGSVGGDALFDLSTILFWIFTLGAMMWLLRDGEKLPILILAASLLLIAVFNRNYFLPGATRYFIYLLPLVYASWAIALLRVWDRLAGTSRSLMWMGRASLVGVVILLIVTSLLRLE